ncbi:MAG: glycosyltransferase family 2 protein [Flavobacteriales bacterium]|nr:glycosyltransferase family 2 protein [Flavobacteriales bacterium]MCB9190973.1 glycosyltransferase family 2 protein [Flavobacteriales bacterium]MCB9204792.1 glycosyltransferase family 2 protein [Flavobacteriales bacterium]
MSAAKTLDIILPCYNPRPGWGKSLSESMTKIKMLLGEGVIESIILVNDGSSEPLKDDELSKLTSTHSEVKLIEYPKNQGKGFAVRKGISSGNAHFQLYTDIDVPYVEESVKLFYNLLKNDEADVVLASRGDSYYNALSGFRRILSKSLRWLNGILFGLKISDTQGGLKAFNHKGRKVFLQTRVNRYLFDLEFIQKASKTDLRLIGLDVELKQDIVLPSPSLMILLKELGNFIVLLFRK